MKTVFDNDGVAHAWARGAEQARSSNGNFYNMGRKLYSYGSHFVVGVRCGVDVFALNSNGYSISTNRHKSAARQAAHGTIHYFPDLTNIADTLSHIADVRNRYEKPSATWGEYIRRYLVEHASTISDESGAWLATFAGLRGKAWEKAKSEHARLVKAEAVRAARVKREHECRKAIQYADMSAASWRDYVRSAADDYSGSQRLANLATELRRCRIVAKREKLSLKRLNAIRAKLHYLETCGIEQVAHIAQRQKDKRETIRYIRQWTRATREERDGLPSSGLSTLRYHVDTLLRLVPYMREPLGRFYAELGAEIDARRERERAVYECQREEKRLMREAGAAARKEMWLSGQSGRHGITLSDDNGGALLRAVDVKRDDGGAIVGGTLETGHGADVPLTHAIKAFRFVKLIRESGETWERNGRTVRVGHYQLDRVDADGFTAGCHRINWPEIERLAVELGVIALQPCDAREPSSHAA